MVRISSDLSSQNIQPPDRGPVGSSSFRLQSSSGVSLTPDEIKKRLADRIKEMNDLIALCKEIERTGEPSGPKVEELKKRTLLLRQAIIEDYQLGVGIHDGKRDDWMNDAAAFIREATESIRESFKKDPPTIDFVFLVRSNLEVALKQLQKVKP